MPFVTAVGEGLDEPLALKFTLGDANPVPARVELGEIAVCERVGRLKLILAAAQNDCANESVSVEDVVL